jgi:Fe2+ or Zn2+ uptake regulation protein
MAGSPNDDVLARRLRHLGARVTPHRRLIYQTLRASVEHPDVDTLAQLVRERAPDISLATVYNTLHVLERARLVRAIEDPSGRTRYDANDLPHHHFRCTACGRLDDVPADLAGAPLAGRTPPGYLVTEVRVELVGVCPACRAARGQ